MAPRDKDRTNLKYAAAIGISAAAHAVFLYLVLFALPRWLKTDQTPPPAYTVTIVDNLPAGDLGTHLPRLARSHQQLAENQTPEQEAQEQPEKTEHENNNTKIDVPDTDRNALALNAHPTKAPTPQPTATPTPPPVQTPEPTAAPTAEPTLEPTQVPTAAATRRPRPTIRLRPTPRPQAMREHNRHKPAPPRIKPRVMLAAVSPGPRAARTPTVKERLAILRKQLMEEHLKQIAKAEKARAETASEEADGEETESARRVASNGASGGGPVVGTSASGGRGYGVGPGTGSLGMLRDPEFLLYYQKVQERIKNAWSFGGGNKDLTTTVNFAIGPDGKLTGLEVAHSSNNVSFDQSVMRAIRGAAPFPPPPQHYRDQFAQGVQAVFKLGELSS